MEVLCCGLWWQLTHGCVEQHDDVLKHDCVERRLYMVVLNDMAVLNNMAVLNDMTVLNLLEWNANTHRRA